MKRTEIQVAVLKGGFSRERAVSLRTGAAAAAALRSSGCRVEEVDVRHRRWRLPAGTDVVFVALHGAYGEDGELQDTLEKRGLPFTGSDAAACRRAFDKAASKARFREAGLATPEGIVLRGREKAPKAEELPFSLPAVVKPAREGSSLGVRIVRAASELPTAVQIARRSDEIVLVERYIPGREFTVGVLGEKALPVIEICPKNGWYDYRNKYTVGNTEYRVPAPLRWNLRKKIQNFGLRAHQVLGCRDISRADFRLDETGEIYLLEVNTIPGMTKTSLLPKAAAAAGIAFPKLCRTLVECALNRGKILS
ncbi:MAG: D-alanine--D-alanine ligase [Verrucomicrobiae bacterium]|nr:D-alanine--D-alanine ligase [Verrucomicrobiae bacterium]